MTLQELTSDELDKLKEASTNTVLSKLLESRLEDIKNDDFAVAVKDVEGMLKREYRRGMYEAFKSISGLGEAVKEEYELRKKEEALAQENKR